MPPYVNRSELLLRMEKQADYDTQPRACRRMMRVVSNCPGVKVVPADVFEDLLSQCHISPEEKEQWKQKAGLV